MSDSGSNESGYVALRPRSTSIHDLSRQSFPVGPITGLQPRIAEAARRILSFRRYLQQFRKTPGGFAVPLQLGKGGRPADESFSAVDTVLRRSREIGHRQLQGVLQLQERGGTTEQRFSIVGQMLQERIETGECGARLAQVEQGVAAIAMRDDPVGFQRERGIEARRELPRAGRGHATRCRDCSAPRETQAGCGAPRPGRAALRRTAAASAVHCPDW